MPPFTLDSLAEMQQAVDAHALVSATDLRGSIVHVNDKFCEISGYSREELLGTNHRILKSGVHPDEFFLKMWQTIRSGRIWQGQICNRRKDGTLYWVESTIMPVSGGYLSLRTDITQLKEQEHELRVLHETARSALDKEVRIMSLISHELRTPLSGILGMADLLLGENVSPTTRETVEVIHHSAEHLNTIVHELLNYANMRSGIMRPRYHRFVLQELLSSLIQTYSRIAESRGLEFQAHLSRPKAEFLSDGRLIQEVVSNLLSNAVKFTESGKIELKTWIQGTKSSPELVIEIEDTGPGIPEDLKSRVTEAFTQAVDYSRRDYGGLGLGLTISQELTGRLGGALEITSSAEGTLVRIRIPEKLAERNRPVESVNLPQILGRIALVVEDEPSQRQMLRQWLSDLGCLVETAANGVEAVDLASRKIYDLIFMDLSMPLMDGLEAAVRIRRFSHTDQRRAPGLIVAVSAHNDSLLEILGTGSGFDTALSKPVRKNDLIAFLKTYFSLNLV